MLYTQYWYSDFMYVARAKAGYTAWKVCRFWAF